MEGNFRKFDMLFMNFEPDRGKCFAAAGPAGGGSVCRKAQGGVLLGGGLIWGVLFEGGVSLPRWKK